jgi:hypothetical protein
LGMCRTSLQFRSAADGQPYLIKWGGRVGWTV